MVPATVTDATCRRPAASRCRLRLCTQVRLPLVCLGAVLLSGCATMSGLLASKMFTATGLLSLAATGKGIADHALTLLMEEDCRILDGVLREDREICEESGSPATERDFKGLIAMLSEEPTESSLSDTYRFDRNDELALELSNMTGRSAGDIGGRPVALRFDAVPYQLQLETRLPGRRLRVPSPYLLAGLTPAL